MKATRTVNPLHFEDLDPHRFEDLIRQLMYDFRQWLSLEAIGRTGQDEGIDIRATEISQTGFEMLEDENGDEHPVPQTNSPIRLWSIQCKREHRIGPTKVKSIVSDNLSTLTDKPYGYMLVAPCDFSKAARDAFREEASSQGIQEFYIWGKAEIEDQLFLPKNDHLLFAYFGISLQIRRRSLKTNARNRLALKKKLTSSLGGIDLPGHEYVLIRDPRDDNYPNIENVSDFIKSPKWRYWSFFTHNPPDHLAFVYTKHYAYLNFETKEYDILPQFDAGIPSWINIYDLPDNYWDPDNLSGAYHQFWYNEVPEANRAYAYELRIIPYDRIIAVDEIGDCCNKPPHLLVEYYADRQPFEPNRFALFIETNFGQKHTLDIKRQGKRIPYFPSVIPPLEK